MLKRCMQEPLILMPLDRDLNTVSGHCRIMDMQAALNADTRTPKYQGQERLIAAVQVDEEKAWAHRRGLRDIATADARNCVYPNRKEITSGDELKEAVRFDHVCGEFKKNYRNINNFPKSNVIVMDCDNDHSEDPEDWITFKKREELFKEIDYAAAPRRNHMKEKDGKLRDRSSMSQRFLCFQTG